MPAPKSNSIQQCCWKVNNGILISKVSALSGFPFLSSTSCPTSHCPSQHPRPLRPWASRRPPPRPQRPSHPSPRPTPSSQPTASTVWGLCDDATQKSTTCPSPQVWWIFCKTKYHLLFLFYICQVTTSNLNVFVGFYVRNQEKLASDFEV